MIPPKARTSEAPTRCSARNGTAAIPRRNVKGELGAQRAAQGDDPADADQGDADCGPGCAALRILNHAAHQRPFLLGLVGWHKAQEGDVEAQCREVPQQRHPGQDIGVDSITVRADDPGGHELRHIAQPGADNEHGERGNACTPDRLARSVFRKHGLDRAAPMARAKPPLSVSPVAAASTPIRRKSELRVIWRPGRCAVSQQGIDWPDLFFRPRTSPLAQFDRSLFQAVGGRGSSHASCGRLAPEAYRPRHWSSRFAEDLFADRIRTTARARLGGLAAREGEPPVSPGAHRGEREGSGEGSTPARAPWRFDRRTGPPVPSSTAPSESPGRR